MIHGRATTRSDWTICTACLQKQQKIDRLEEELRRVKAKLRYQERTAREGPFGASTPSSKIPIKANSLEEHQARKGGAKPGHRGYGRRVAPPEQIHRTLSAHLPACCPDCGTELQHRGRRRRTVLDAQPLRAERQLWLLDVKRCPKCRKTFRAKPPGVPSKGLLSNRLLAVVAIEHYLHGRTLGQLQRQLGVGYGAICQAMHALAKRLAPVMPRLLRDYRAALVKHADETGWRSDGRSGYAWLFCTPRLSFSGFAAVVPPKSLTKCSVPNPCPAPWWWIAITPTTKPHAPSSTASPISPATSRIYRRPTPKTRRRTASSKPPCHS